MVVVTSWGKDHGVGVGASTVIIFDMSSGVVGDNQVGIHYTLPFLDFLLKTVKDGEWMHIEVRVPLIHFCLLKGLAFFTSFFSLFHFQCLPATCYGRKARRERKKGEVLWKQRNMFKRN